MRNNFLSPWLKARENSLRSAPQILGLHWSLIIFFTQEEITSFLAITPKKD